MTLLAVALLIGSFVLLLRPYFIGIRPAWFPSERVSSDWAAFVPLKNSPFTTAENVEISLFNNDVKNPRVMIEDQTGNVLVSEPSIGRVSSISKAGERVTLIEGLLQPHGLALRDGFLYVAETAQVLRYAYDGVTAADPQVLLSLPSGGRHWTRTIGFGPDDGLYISIGSSCNICLEEDWRRDKILRYDLQTQALEDYAVGLRNAVFFAWHPETGELYATEMGRDWLGDDLPPDELNKIIAGGNYGFPYCYGKNVVDPEFNQSEKCASSFGSHYDFTAHEAPLGIDFLNGDIIVALHGSWNRSEPVGYEVIRLTETSGYQERETILSGFLRQDGSSIGRPAGILTLSDGTVLVSDDKGDAVYRLHFLETL